MLPRPFPLARTVKVCWSSRLALGQKLPLDWGLSFYSSAIFGGGGRFRRELPAGLAATRRRGRRFLFIPAASDRALHVRLVTESCCAPLLPPDEADS